MATSSLNKEFYIKDKKVWNKLMKDIGEEDMKIIRCDICGKELEDGVYYPSKIEHYMLPLWQEEGNGERHIAIDEADLCEDCAVKIADFIERKCDANVGQAIEIACPCKRKKW